MQKTMELFRGEVARSGEPVSAGAHYSPARAHVNEKAYIVPKYEQAGKIVSGWLPSIEE